ncbi:hypothetical protein V1512DRAFT_251562 [Lipomyces arxii]|uniref:uncharacterized protein n=1 Tax=Lipomyces arxii TaxID=56418 RepID=UPI0034CE13D2
MAPKKYSTSKKLAPKAAKAAVIKKVAKKAEVESVSPIVSDDEGVIGLDVSTDEEIDEDYSDAEFSESSDGDVSDAVRDSDIEAEFSGLSGSDEDSENEEEEVKEKENRFEKLELKLPTTTEQDIKDKIASKKGDSSNGELKLTKKERRELAAAKNERPGVLYIGRIPHGFYETQMRSYFSQFGDILRLRLSRNKKTGASKHYAFIEFGSSDVAEIVAETMNNYLLYGHILKVSVVPEAQVHEKLFVGSNRKFKKIPATKLAKHKHDKKRTNEEMEKLVSREEKRRKEKQTKLNELGIDYTIPTRPLKSH